MCCVFAFVFPNHFGVNLIFAVRGVARCVILRVNTFSTVPDGHGVVQDDAANGRGALSSVPTETMCCTRMQQQLPYAWCFTAPISSHFH
uniref:Putative secreted protein n=1 Tax=Hyalomma excavatum TaxID=257692 RepID=A0A131XMS7_9ACAR